LANSQWGRASAQARKNDRAAANPDADAIVQNGATDGRHVAPTTHETPIIEDCLSAVSTMPERVPHNVALMDGMVGAGQNGESPGVPG